MDSCCVQSGIEAAWLPVSQLGFWQAAEIGRFSSSRLGRSQAQPARNRVVFGLMKTDLGAVAVAADTVHMRTFPEAFVGLQT